MLRYILSIFLLSVSLKLAAQDRTAIDSPNPSLPAHAIQAEDDPCGFLLRKPGDIQVWAYGRDALLSDMQGWALHPMTAIDVIGSSVQGRPLYHMVFTNPASQHPKKRIWIHARTHPIESESSFVARAVVEELLSGSALGNLLLDNAIIHVLPMLNPDGVELQWARENANGVDLESNWGAAAPEPEVEALRRHLTALMNSHSPVEVALNLHSAYNCKRYFVYHAVEGTSEVFSQLEQRFINYARARFPGGIEPYNYFVSWTTGTPDRYPESWFWRSYGQQVMALTYEDMNCATAGEYQRTARALLGAAGDYLGLTGVVSAPPPAVGSGQALLADLYPNPVQTDGSVSIRLQSLNPALRIRVALFDYLGRQVAAIYEGSGFDAGHTLVIPTGSLPSGTYYLRASAGAIMETRTLLILR
ncbi:MAG: M14 family zinc carboxypeptidase [Bacteroidota bacterium]